MTSESNSGSDGDDGREEKLANAIRLLRSGMSLVQVRSDGSKAPASELRPYFERRPSEGEVLGWIKYCKNDFGILGGSISGNLGILDFDTKHDEGIFDNWKSSLERKRPGLLDRLPLVVTPSGGCHVYFRSHDKLASLDLARTAKGEGGGGDKEKELIGLRAEGKYAVAPGPQSNGYYKHAAGPPLSDVPVLTAVEVADLIVCARAYDRRPKDARPDVEDAVSEDDRLIRLPICDRLPQHEKETQAERYILKCPGGRPGGARKYAYALAMELVHGFDLDPEVAERLLYEWGRKDDNVNEDGHYYPWGRSEIRDKIRSTSKNLPKEPVGSRLRQPPVSSTTWTDDDIDGAVGEAVVPSPPPSEDDIFAGGDEREACGGPATEDTTAATSYSYRPIDSKTFAAAKYKVEWLVRNLLVRGQAGVIGGPKKVLKTSILVDLAVSLGTGLPFLDHFGVYKKCRTSLISGESGEFTLQETARRICVSKRIDLADVDCLWDFRLPQLSVEAELEALSRGLCDNGVEVCVIDPLYLCLLSGQDAKGKNAANLFDMGPTLMAVGRACLSAGCTPLLVHHARKNSLTPHEPLDLEDLAFSGISEFARQWLLINRRNAYRPGTGVHELWMGAGGSCGQGGLWGLDIDEAVLQDDFSGRKWEVDVLNLDLVKEKKRVEKDAKKASGDDELDGLLLAALDAWPTPPCTKTKLRDSLGWRNDKFNRVFLRLQAKRVIHSPAVTIVVGKGAKRSAEGVARVS